MNTEILPEFSEVVTLADELSWEFVFRYEGVGASGRGFRHNYKIAWLIDEKSSLHEPRKETRDFSRERNCA